MKTRDILLTGAVALTFAVATGCKREEPKTAPPPASVAATPERTAPPPASGAATPEPPNPPNVTGLEPKPAPAPAEAGPAERAGRVIGEKLDDATITAKVKTALLQAPDVKGTNVNVTTEKMVVQLSGFVSTQTEMERAVQIARGVNGVKEVHNKMSLKSGN